MEGNNPGMDAAQPMPWWSSPCTEARRPGREGAPLNDEEIGDYSVTLQITVS
jgi:hypothetical protein